MFVLTKEPSIANHFLAELRDINIQKDRKRFRQNLERLGELLAYEISKSLVYQTETVTTPLGTASTQLLTQQPILATILRASLPFHQGFLNVFDHADNAFIGAYRGHHVGSEDFEIEMDYIAAPNLDGRVLIIIDPMLATGRSLEKVYQALLKFGTPAQTHIAAVIASPEGLEYLQEKTPDCKLWVAAIDEKLDENAYIVPGLGDAGDLAFGLKQ